MRLDPAREEPAREDAPPCDPDAAPCDPPVVGCDAPLAGAAAAAPTTVGSSSALPSSLEPSLITGWKACGYSAADSCLEADVAMDTPPLPPLWLDLADLAPVPVKVGTVMRLPACDGAVAKLGAAEPDAPCAVRKDAFASLVGVLPPWALLKDASLPTLRGVANCSSPDVNESSLAGVRGWLVSAAAPLPPLALAVVRTEDGALAGIGNERGNASAGAMGSTTMRCLCDDHDGAGGGWVDRGQGVPLEG